MPFDEISFTQCCKIILSDWHFRRENIVPELRDYNRHLLSLLNAEFGIDWRDDDPRDSGFTRLPSNMLRGYFRIAGPFSNLMEFEFLPGQREAMTRHAGTIGEAEADLERKWVELFRDLLLLRWPPAASRKSSWSRLRRLGLGDPVDPIDFF